MNMNQEKKEVMLKLEPTLPGNRSSATRIRRFFADPSGSRGLKVATIFFLCVLIFTFFTFFVSAAEKNHQLHRHRDHDRRIDFPRRKAAASLSSNSTTDYRTSAIRFNHEFLTVAVVVASLLICVSQFLIIILILVIWKLLLSIRTFTSEHSQHGRALPLPDSGSPTIVVDTPSSTSFIPYASRATRDRDRLGEDAIQDRSRYHASSRREVPPRLDVLRNLFGACAGSREPVGGWDSAVTESHVSEAPSSDESPEHRLVRRRRHYEDGIPYPSPCRLSASPARGCQAREGEPITECPTSMVPTQTEICHAGAHLQASSSRPSSRFPEPSSSRQDYDPTHDQYLNSGDLAVDMVQTPHPEPMTLFSPNTNPGLQAPTSGERLGSPRQEQDPDHEPNLHSGDPAANVDDSHETAHSDPTTHSSRSTDPLAPESSEGDSRSTSPQTDGSGSISFRFQLNLPESSGDEPELDSAEDGNAPVAAGDDNNDYGDRDGHDGDEISLPSWTGSPLMPR